MTGPCDGSIPAEGGLVPRLGAFFGAEHGEDRTRAAAQRSPEGGVESAPPCPA